MTESGVFHCVVTLGEDKFSRAPQSQAWVRGRAAVEELRTAVVVPRTQQ